MHPDSSWQKLPPSRTLVLCFDGTADEFDEDNSNVVKFFSMLKKDDEKTQVCYYQAGIGTYFQPGVVSPLFRWAAKALDMAVAWYLDAHVMDGYRFLMQNYRKGDKICLFGFSRGAYVARALAGFLQKVGLLLKDNLEQVPFAYKLYERFDPAGIKIAKQFKSSFCREVEVEFMGVWDTVCSVGILNGRTLPFVNNNKGIKTFRHALALDEHRAKFRPNLWHRPSPPPPPPPPTPHSPSKSKTTSWLFSAPRTNPDGLAPPPPTPPAPIDSRPSESSYTEGLLFREPFAQTALPAHDERTDAPKAEVARAKSATARIAARLPTFVRRRAAERPGHEREPRPTGQHGSHSDSELADVVLALHHAEATAVEPAVPEKGDTDVLEVWFPGCHADVGGGAVSNAERLCLSQVPLRWMVREVTAAQCGIVFDQRQLQRFNVQLSLLGSPRHAGRREKMLDNRDMKAPVNDQLRSGAGRAWWVLECVPTLDRWQDGEGQWRKKWGFNLGRGRTIPKYAKPLYFHFTVKARMEDPTLHYTPRAHWLEGTEEYVE